MTSQSSRACISAICRTSSGTWSVRARATAGGRFPQNRSRASAFSQSAAVFPTSGSVIAAFLPRLRGLARAWSDIPNFVARLGPFFGRGLLPICKFLGAFKTLRCLSSDALVQFLQEPTGRVFHRFFVSPVLSPVPAVHGQTMQHKDTRDHGNSYPQHG
jgi:hypothetical protein